MMVSDRQQCEFVKPCSRYLGLLGERDELQREIGRLTAEIERLLAALTEIRTRVGHDSSFIASEVLAASVSEKE